MSGSTVPQWPILAKYIEDRPEQAYFTYEELGTLVRYDLKRSRGTLIQVKKHLESKGRFVIGQDARGFQLSPPTEVPPDA